MKEFIDTAALVSMAVVFTWFMLKDGHGNAQLRARINKMLDDLPTETEVKK